MDRDVIVAVPTLVLMVKAEDMPQFMDNHPFLLPPPKRRDINLRSRSFFVSHQTGVVSVRQIAGEEDVFLLIRARNETDLRTGIQPMLHAALGDGLLLRRQLRDVVRYDAARPGSGFFGVRIYVSRGICCVRVHRQ